MEPHGVIDGFSGIGYGGLLLEVKDHPCPVFSKQLSFLNILLNSCKKWQVGFVILLGCSFQAIEPLSLKPPQLKKAPRLCGEWNYNGEKYRSKVI